MAERETSSTMDEHAGPAPVVAIEAPKPEPVVKRTTAEIIEDDIPFVLTAAMLFPIAAFIAERIA
jgi:hypothetical protein